jgi:hypothetical protein
MGIFDDLDQADVFANSKYFQPGMFIVDIKACKFITGGHKGDSFVIEATIVATKSDHADAPQPGELAAQVWNASGDKRDIARNTWLGFLCSAYGVEQKAYSGEQWKTISEKVIGEGALDGTRLRVEVFMKTTRAGNPFTQHAWRGVPTAAELAEFGL